MTSQIFSRGLVWLLRAFGNRAHPETAAVLKTLDQLQQQLQDAGENRFPIVEFETKGELPVAD